MAPFGAAVLAAHVITQRLEMFIMMPAMSFGMGAGVLVGQNLGAKQPKRAERSAWMGVMLVEAFVILVATAMMGICTTFLHPRLRESDFHGDLHGHSMAIGISPHTPAGNTQGVCSRFLQPFSHYLCFF
jgi:hypothetical protein